MGKEGEGGRKEGRGGWTELPLASRGIIGPGSSRTLFFDNKMKLTWWFSNITLQYTLCIHVYVVIHIAGSGC